jgi:hypothetical protein
MISAARLALDGHPLLFSFITVATAARSAVVLAVTALLLSHAYRVLAKRQLQRQQAYAEREQRINEAKTFSTCSALCDRSWDAQRYLAAVQVRPEYAPVVAAMDAAWQKRATATLARQRTLHPNDYHFSIPRGSAAGMVFPRECYSPITGLATGFPAASTTYTSTGSGYTSDYDMDSDTLDYDPWPHHNVDGTPMIQGTMLDIHGDSFGTPSAFNSFEE